MRLIQFSPGTFDERIIMGQKKRDFAMNVDEFVKSKVLPEHRGIVEQVRQYMRELAPDAQEVISYGIPAFKGNRVLAVISPTKKDITLAFSHSAEFEDKYGLLQGVGKVSKHLKFKTASEVKKEVVRYYITQAMDLDSKHPHSVTSKGP